MSEQIDQYFGEVRALLNGAPSQDAWVALCLWMTEAWEENPDEVRAKWLPYVGPLLEAWPDEVKIAPEEWRSFGRLELHELCASDVSPFAALAGKHDARTGNNAVSHSTTGDALLDYFSKAGTYRDREYEDVAKDLSRCWETSDLLTVRMLFYLRAVSRKTRGFYHAEQAVNGQGGRDEWRKGMRWLATKHPDAFYQNLWLVPTLGVWKDLWHAELLPYIDAERVYDLIEVGMEDDYNRELIAKYLPKVRSKANRHNPRHELLHGFQTGLRKRLGWSQKDYRALKKSGSSHEFQRAMCARRWEDLEWARIPGRALSQMIYNRGKADNLSTLQRHDLVDSFSEFMEGRTTLNFSGYPYELIGHAKRARHPWERSAVDKQFEALIELARGDDGEGIQGDVLCALDTSGSMGAQVADTSAFDICIGLGLYLSALNEGFYKDRVVMFDSTSRTLELSGGFTQRYRQVMRSRTAWGSTNFQSVIDELVRQREANMDAPARTFPGTLVVISDMQFNPVGGNTQTNYEAAMAKLEAVGLGRMRIVWWWVTGLGGDFPSRLDDEGVIMIGGFDGSILTLLLGGEEHEQVVVDAVTGEPRKLDAFHQMLRALDQEVLRLVQV